MGIQKFLSPEIVDRLFGERKIHKNGMKIKENVEG